MYHYKYFELLNSNSVSGAWYGAAHRRRPNAFLCIRRPMRRAVRFRLKYSDQTSFSIVIFVPYDRPAEFTLPASLHRYDYICICIYIYIYMYVFIYIVHMYTFHRRNVNFVRPSVTVATGTLG